MPLGMQTSSIRGLSQARINWDGCGRKSIQHKNGGWWRWGSNSLCGIASKQAVGAFASAICPCAIKCRRWWAVMEKVDKWFSEFCITVGTASILIHSLLKALAVNMSRPSGQLWLYAGLIGSNNTCWLKALLLTQSTVKGMRSHAVDLVCVNPSSCHGCEWVNASYGTGSLG